MKKIIKLVAFWSFALLCAHTPLRAQEQLPIIPLEDHVPWRKHEVYRDIKYAYFKDVHNILDPMVGHWSAEKGNYLYDFWITKQEYVEIPQGRHDNLIVQYGVYEKGKKILFSTLPITLQKRPRIPKGFRYYPITIQFYNHPTIVYESVVPIYLQALCHSLLIEKIKNLNNDSSVSFLKSPSSQDFGLVLDYYAQHTKQAPSALADQYVREMGDVIALFGDDLDDVAPILWWGIRNSASFSELPLMEQARIDDILSTLGYIIRENMRRPMEPNPNPDDLK